MDSVHHKRNDAINSTQLIGSVGKGGKNHKPDVERVQAMLLMHGYNPGNTEGFCTDDTINAIVKFQARFMASPDGRVDPTGRTWKRLCIQPLAHGSPQEALANKWSGNPAKWSQEQKLEGLNPCFREKVKILLDRLRKRGYRPSIFYGWRSIAIQLELYKKGNSKVKFSFHNAQLPDGTPNSYAADIVDERWGWSNDAEKNGFWQAMGEEANQLGLVWGETGKTLKMLPMFRVAKIVN